MRKITEEATDAFYHHYSFSKGNTQVYEGSSEITDMDCMKMLLHGNLIAILDHRGLRISNAGWFTNTTKERLNALSGVNIYQKKGIWYLNGKEWNGEWVKINYEWLR